MSSVLDTYAQITADFTPQPRRYGILNASPEPVERMFSAMIFIFPGRNDIGPRPCLDADGDPIPGSLYIEDGCRGTRASTRTTGRSIWSSTQQPPSATSWGSPSRRGRTGE